MNLGSRTFNFGVRIRGTGPPDDGSRHGYKLLQISLRLDFSTRRSSGKVTVGLGVAGSWVEGVSAVGYSSKGADGR